MGKAACCIGSARDPRKHPHACGESSSPRMYSAYAVETPPRVWGKRPPPCIFRVPGGNTPTRMGKAPSPNLHSCPQGKHPHAYGESPSCQRAVSLAVETPPRVWGKLTRSDSAASVGGNTPTRVGKAERRGGRRAEDGETPPRVWGKPHPNFLRSWVRRNTPTRVGKALHCEAEGSAIKKHPHACGESKRRPWTPPKT